MSMKRYFDSLLIYMQGKSGGYKLYTLHRFAGTKINFIGTKVDGEVIWKYRIVPIHGQPHWGFTTIDEIHEHAYKLFKGRKELFDQWAKELQKDGYPINIGKLRNALLYQWEVDNG